MWGGSTIRHLQDEAARKAAVFGKRPYVPFDHDEIDRYGDEPIPFPNIGSYAPPGWEKAGDENGDIINLFVDSSGCGSPCEPALTLDQLKQKLHELQDSDETYGYAITEVGQFQLYITAFKRTGEPEKEEVDEEAAESVWEYEKQLEHIRDGDLSMHLRSDITAAETPDEEEDWAHKVWRWLWENDQEALILVDNYSYMPNLTWRRVLPAIVDMGMLDPESDLILRDVDLDGYRLLMCDCREPHRQGRPQQAIYYRLVHPDGWIVFEGSDFGANETDSDDTVRSLISFLTLRKGDTDDEYFKDYTPEQLEWRDSSAEELSMWGVEPEQLEDDPFTMYEVDGEETRFKPWGWEEKDAT